MKLGDSMAPIEPCSVWNDICPLKTRPPKIGDIPRHVAVDEESPGCSSSRSLGQFTEAKSSKSMLETSSSCQNERGRSKISEALPIIRDFFKSAVSTKSSEKILRIRDKITSDNRSDDSKIKIITNETFNYPLPIFDKFSENSGTPTRLEIRQEDLSLRVTESTDLEDYGASLEDDIPEAIYQVRKDSALYIEERNNDCSKLGLGLDSRYLGTRECLNPCENLEETENSKLFKPQARRESSGYFSNLGTFDEDRWIASAMDIGNQQDLIATREISSRDRRRSITKNRIPITLNQQQQQSIQATMGLPCGQQSTKIQNLVCPSGHIDETSQLSDDCKFIPKSSHVEMPNIKEQRSLELEKPIDFVPTDSSEIMKHSSDISINDLTNELSQISFGNLSRSCIDVTTRTATNSSEDLDKDKTGEAEDSTRKRFNSMDSEDHKSVGSSNDLESITKKANGENLDKKGINDPSDIGEDSVSRSSRIAIEISDEYDDDDDVVVAILEPKKDQISATGSKKPLPKPIKVYQLLSTQSEDRGDGEKRIYNRRISLQITGQNDNERSPETSHISVPTEQRNYACSIDEKKLIHADSVPILKIPSSTDIVNAETKCRDDTITAGKDKSGLSQLYTSTSGSSLCINERINPADKATGTTIAGIRPIYPYCPYSPYASPHGSPRTSRRRPLRESRRVSIDSRQGALQLNQYKLLNNIGQGSYGIVKLAYNEEDDTHYAMKILSKKKLMKKAGIFGRMAPGRKGSANPLAKVYREIALLKKLDHPNVVKLVEVLDDPDEDNLYLVFELVERGEVLQLPTDKPLDEETARRYFRDVVMGVEYLHYQRIVHRDIKPSNLLVDSEGRVKVADLGVSAELRAAGELLSGSAGTPAFAAPETTTPGAEYSGTLCDVWSMGVTLYSLVFGKVPWDGAGSIIGVQAAIRSEQLRFPEVPSLSDNLNDLVSRMLAKDPIKRINLAEIKEHCWLTNNGSEPLPSETENCRLPVTVTDEEVARVVTRVPKLDTLILIKTMLKQHSFQNPFLARRFVKTIGDAASGGTSKQQSSIGICDSQNHSCSTGATTKNKTEQFHRAGRSNSAPDSYEWQINGRQISSDSLLPPVTESSSQEVEMEKR